MLGLPEQVTGNERRICRVIGDYQDLRRAGKQIDSATAEKLTFGFGHVPIPCAAKNVNRLVARRPNAMSAIAGTPPTTQILSAPALSIALIVAGYQPCPFTGGVQATIPFTPATRAGIILICADPNIG